MAAMRLLFVVTGLLFVAAAGAGAEDKHAINFDVLKALALEHKEEITAALQATLKKGVEDFFTKIRASIPEDIPVDEPHKPSTRILGGSAIEVAINTFAKSNDPYPLNNTLNVYYSLYDKSASINVTAGDILATGISALSPKVTRTPSGTFANRNNTFDVKINLDVLNVAVNHNEILAVLFVKQEGEGNITIRISNIIILGDFVTNIRAGALATFLEEECDFSLSAGNVEVEIDTILGSSILSPTVNGIVTDYLNEELESILNILNPVVSEQVCKTLKELPSVLWLTVNTSIDLP